MDRRIDEGPLWARAAAELSQQESVGALDDDATAADLSDTPDFWDRVEARVSVLRREALAAA